MYLDAVDLMQFYHRRQGTVVCRLLAHSLQEVWQTPETGTLVGIGYCVPYLPDVALANEKGLRVVALMPARQGVVRWPPYAPAATALVQETALPLTSGSVEQVLAVHALEMSNMPQALLDEIWRVLVPRGELIAVVPNRRSPWTRVDTTPFGYGAPFSKAQIRRLLRAANFKLEAWTGAIHVPPMRGRTILRWADTLEKSGRRLWPGLSGLVIVRASKQPFQAEAVGQPLRGMLRPVLMPDLKPEARNQRPAD